MGCDGVYWCFKYGICWGCNGNVMGSLTWGEPLDLLVIHQEPRL